MSRLPDHIAPGLAPIACTGPSCRVCRLIDPASPDYREDYRRLFHPAEFPAVEAPPSPPPPPPTPPPNPHAARRLLVLGCDYRLEPVGLEKGEGCSCQARTACLLRRGKWADDPARVDYADCLVCVGGGT